MYVVIENKLDATLGETCNGHQIQFMRKGLTVK